MADAENIEGVASENIEEVAAEEVGEVVSENIEEVTAEEVEEEVVEKKKTKEFDLTDNVIFVGKKDTMSYIFAVMTQFNNGVNEIVLKARGKAISRAVDVAERVRNQFVTDANPTDIRISTEEIQGDEGTIKVSAIEITMSK